ncbi:MAG TPA: NAD(P)-dependent oxidoreductase [Thermoanaerobaculia bacterium]|nr:NAD(P)-dependent oxidoreductase [Thermoanaerobaculia bacterium]
MGRRIFLTGATGVIGRRLVPLLVADGAQVTAAVRSASSERKSSELGARAVRVDLFDAAAVTSAVRGHDTIINLATRIPLGMKGLLPGSWRENDRIRTEVSRNLVFAAAAAEIGTMVQESFALVYRDGGDSWISEDSPLDPVRHTRSALVAETNALELPGRPNLSVVLRFALLYGEDSPHTRDMIAMARRGRAATFGPPGAYVPMLHLDDAALAIVAALSAPTGRYNVTDDEPLTNEALFAALAHQLGVPPPRFPPRWSARLAGSVGTLLSRSQRLSNAAFRKAAGWRPLHRSVREGFASILAG